MENVIHFFLKCGNATVSVMRWAAWFSTTQKKAEVPLLKWTPVMQSPPYEGLNPICSAIGFGIIVQWRDMLYSTDDTKRNDIKEKKRKKNKPT